MSLRALARPLICGLSALYRRPGARRLMVEAIEEFDAAVPVDDRDPPIRLHVASRMEHQRATTFHGKEPDTIQWLDRLAPGDLFVDIGANIGVYSLYAAMRRGARVFAFEPGAQNFAALNRNIHLNGANDKVLAFPIAASDSAGATVLNLSRFEVGGSHNSVDEPIGEGGDRFRPAFVQGAVADRLDALLGAWDGAPVPRFVKIDVDGIEPRVVAGMGDLLADKRLEEILIEMNPEEENGRRILDLLAPHGFAAGPPAWTKNGRGNHIFRRETP